MNWAGLALALGSVVTAGAHGTPVFTFADPSITESSALVDFGSFMVTSNDSGGGPLVFVIDSASGRTIATTTFTDHVEDVEALAPAGPGAVWVGDIGDNLAQRPDVRVYRVPVSERDQRMHAPSYDLVYPDGPHDAESLVAGPDGRLRIITKSLAGGRVYTAPKVLDPNRPNLLRAGRTVDLYATDAALFPGGRRILVRGYGAAMIATFPGFRPIAEFPLPIQEQGEGVSIASSGRIRLSSEGVHSPVLQVRLPAAARALLHPASATPTARAVEAAPVPSESSGIPAWVWAAGGGVLGLVGLVVLRRRR